MKFAVVEIAGKQFLVREGDVIETPKLDGKAGDKMVFSQVLLSWDGKKLALGKPTVKELVVEGLIVEEGKGPKITSYKFKRRKGYHRKKGHRQDVFKVEIKKIAKSSKETSKEKEPPKKEKPAAAPKAPVRKKPAAKKAPAKKKPETAKRTPKAKKPEKADK